MCYYYDGDGVCEDFEQETGVRDCGLYTPNGFLDQWAATVEVSHEQKPYCSGEVAAGYPAVTKVGPDTVCLVQYAVDFYVILNYKLNTVFSFCFYGVSQSKPDLTLFTGVERFWKFYPLYV